MTSALLLLTLPVVTDKTGFYSVETTIEYSRSGKVVGTMIEEQLMPAGTIIGKVGHSYYRGTSQGRELLLERDEKTYDGWWSAPPLKKAGRDLFNSPEADAARMDEMRSGPFTMGGAFAIHGRLVSNHMLPARRAYGLSFSGQKLVFNDGSWTKEWATTVAGDAITLYSEAERKGGRTVQRLTTLRKPLASDVAKLSISNKHPHLPADSRGMMRSMAWFMGSRP